MARAVKAHSSSNTAPSIAAPIVTYLADFATDQRQILHSGTELEVVESEGAGPTPGRHNDAYARRLGALVPNLVEVPAGYVDGGVVGVTRRRGRTRQLGSKERRAKFRMGSRRRPGERWGADFELRRQRRTIAEERFK